VKNAKEYYSGYFGDATLMVFPNKNPGGPRNRPDYLVYVAEPPEKKEKKRVWE
jgi:hypothetical protein